MNSIPFENTADPFYNPENMRVLQDSIREADAGKVAIHELIECQHETETGDTVTIAECRTHYGKK